MFSSQKKSLPSSFGKKDPSTADHKRSAQKTIVVMRRTRLDNLVMQYNTASQAEFVIQSRGGDFSDYLSEHQQYHQALDIVESQLQSLSRVQRLERDFLPNFIFGPQDIVVVLGQDGLVANVMKYLQGQPLIAINPDPQRYDGILLPFTLSDISSIFQTVQKKHHHSQEVTMGEMTLNDGQSLLAVNDFFLGPKYQTSARYDIQLDNQQEKQSSSGIIVSTGLGSTGWLKSVLVGASEVTGTEPRTSTMPWDANYLCYAVREPFPSKTTGTSLVFGHINEHSHMTVTSHMPNDGVIFSDGMIDDAIEFNSGAEATFSIAKIRGSLVKA